LCSSVLRITQTVGANLPAGETFPRRLKFLIFYLIFAVIMQVYSLYYHWGILLKMCNIAITYVLVLQLAAKTLSRSIKNDEKLLPEINKIIDDFYKTHEKDVDFRRILDSYIEIFEFITRSQIILMFLIFHTPPTISWMKSLVTQEYVMVVDAFLPFTDPQTLFGYLINQTYLTTVCSFLFVFLSSGELYFLYATLHVIPMVEILNLKLDRFAKSLEKFEVRALKVERSATVEHNKDIWTQKVVKPKSSSISDAKQSFPPQNTKPGSSINTTKPKTTEPTPKQQLIKIIQDHNIYNNYIRKILDFMEMATFMTFTLSSIGIGLSLLTIRTDENTMGIGTVILFTLQVFMQCVEGSIIAHQNEKFLNEVCGFPWYKLSKDEKKIFLQFIHACQNTNNLSVPIIGNLDMGLFADVANGSYSFLMFILNFVNV